MNNNKLKMIDLFAGIGGVRLGFKKTNKVETVFSCEIDKNAVETYMDNFGDDAQCDITDVDVNNVPDCDILSAGFPCQSFSIAGKKLGFNDTRGTLFFEVARIIKDKMPKAVFLENVKGLVGHDKGKTFATIINTLDELGYNVHWKILNAMDFGIPQKRERVYIVAIRKDIQDSDKFSFYNGSKKETTIADILEKNVDAKYFISKQYFSSLEKHKERHKNKGNGFGFQIISKNDVANTIVCGGMGRERNLVVDNSTPVNIKNRKKPANSHNVRAMTPREWARLQGFPENFKLPKYDTRSYKQFGNSVAVPVIHSIARRIVKKIGG